MVADFHNKEEYYNMCLAVEEMAGNYKKLYQSREYRNGMRLAEYGKLIKKMKLLSAAKRLFHRSGNLDQFIDCADFELECNCQDYFSDKRIVVYTAIFGKYDALNEPMVKPDNVDYYIFTDCDIPDGSRWIKMDPNKFLPDSSMTNTEKNRFFKMLPHKIFPEYDYSVYIDGNVLVVSDVTPLTKTLERFPIAMFQHKNRNCVYQEAEACIIKKKDSKESLEKHIELLKSHNVPEHNGLLEATVICRKHSDPRCVSLMESWWDEFMNYSKRDQISLIDCLWQAKILPSDVGVLGNNLFNCNKFIILKHE